MCNDELIEGAFRFSGVWAIPSTALRPIDHRVKSGKYIKQKESYATPILKWAGGKRNYLVKLSPECLAVLINI